MRKRTLGNKIRYWLIKYLMKKITPSFYKELRIYCKEFIDFLPRPAITFMKEYFQNRKISGVEIGVYKADNSKSILKELNINKLFLIDIWNDTKNFRNYKYVKKYFKKDNRVMIKKDTSINFVKTFKDNDLDFVYIDGNHTYDYVFNDIYYWSKKVKSKGVIAGHDILNCLDVLLALKDYCFINHIYFKVIPPDFYFIKK